MAKPTAGVLRALSIVVCLIACVSFLLFAVNRTSAASGRQQRALAETQTTVTEHESSLRRTIDEISETFSSPVAGLSKSEWGERALRLLFVLLVFGFAVGFIARVVRIRA
jgi:hypothetical protein